MANIYDDAAEAAARAQQELATFGQISADTAAKLNVANAAVAAFETKMNLATAASSALYKTFTSYNRAVLDGVKSYGDLAETTDNLATAFEAVTAALAFILPIGRAAKIVTAGLGLLGGELIRSSKAVGQQLDGLRSGFDELARVGGTTARGLSDMFDAMQQAGVSAKDFPAFAKALAENSQILSTFGGSVTRGRDTVLGLTEDLRPMRDQLMNYGIRIEQIGEASMGFIKNQKLMSMGTNANLNMGKDAMMSYVKELDLLTRLTGLSRQDQEKLREEAMSNAAYAATIDQLLAENRKDEAEAIQQAQVYFARLGSSSLKGFRDSISGFVGTTSEASDLQLASNMEVMKFADDLRAGRLKNAEDIARGAQSVYREIDSVNKTVGRSAAQLGTSFGTIYSETHNVGPMLGESAKDMIARAQAEQEKRDLALKKQNEEFINANDKMIHYQKVLQNQVSRYQDAMGATTTSLGWLGDMAIKAGEALGLLAGEKNPKPPSAAGTSRGVPTSGAAMGETKGGAAGAGAAPASSMGVPPPGAGVARPEQAPQLAAIRDLIGKVESYGGDYNVAVGGAKYNLTDMTIKEVMDLQRKLIASKQGSAVGKYQVIATTLSEAVAKLGISRDEKFDQATQDRIGDYLIMKRGYAQYANNPTQEAKERFLTNLAAEWAGLPAGPDGRSRYAGVGNNKAGIGWNEALEKFADGGTLGAGKMGIAGEAGAELITGPADITPMNDLMSAVRDLMGVMQMSLSTLESINRNTSSAADVSDRMLRLAQN